MESIPKEKSFIEESDEIFEQEDKDKSSMRIKKQQTEDVTKIQPPHLNIY